MSAMKEVIVDVPFGATIVLRQVGAAPAAADELVELSESGLEKKARDALRADGTLPAVKIGRRWYCKRSALVALVDLLAVVPTPKKPAKEKPVPGAVYDFAKATGGGR